MSSSNSRKDNQEGVRSGENCPSCEVVIRIGGYCKCSS